VRHSSRREYKKSDSPVMQSMVEQDDGKEAEYSEDKIFIGWKLGDKNLYQNLEDWAVRNQGSHNTQAIQLALRQFQREAGDRKDTLSLNQSSASIELVVGERGSGKTFFERARSNREAEAGVLNIIVDRKHEYYSNNIYSGIQEDLKNLGEHEEKKNIDTTALLPYFVRKARNRIDGLSLSGDRYVNTFKFNFSDLDPQMLSYLFLHDIDEQSSRYMDFQKYVRNLRQKMDDGEIKSFTDCEDLAKRMGQANRFNYNRRQEEITDKLNKYKDWEFLGDGHNLYDDETMRAENLDGIGLEKLVQETNTIALSLDDAEQLPNQLEMTQIYLAILVKKLRNLKRTNDLEKKVKLCIDEAHEFIDSDNYDSQREAPPAHWQVRQVIKVDRDKGFRVSLATQEVEDIPEKQFLKQVDHAFLPMNIDSDTRNYLLRLFDVHGGSVDEGNKKWQKILDSLPEFAWMYVRKKTKYWSLLEVASPLAYHREED